MKNKLMKRMTSTHIYHRNRLKNKKFKTLINNLFKKKGEYIINLRTPTPEPLLYNLLKKKS